MDDVHPCQIGFGDPFLSDFTLTISPPQQRDTSSAQESNCKRQKVTYVDRAPVHGLALCKAEYFYIRL